MREGAVAQRRDGGIRMSLSVPLLLAFGNGFGDCRRVVDIVSASMVSDRLSPALGVFDELRAAAILDMYHCSRYGTFIWRCLARQINVTVSGRLSIGQISS